MKKKFKIIFAILAILLLVAIVLLIIISKMWNQEGHTHGDDEFEDEAYELEEPEKEEIMPDGISEFVLNYKGEWNRKHLYEGIYKFVHILPEYVDTLTDIKEEDLEYYFEDNKGYIYDNFGLIYSYEFIDFANYLKKYNDIGEYKCSEIVDDTFKDVTNYSRFKLLCTFENEDGKETDLLFLISFSNYLDVEPIIKYRYTTPY